MSAGSKIEWTDATWNPVRARHYPRTAMAFTGEAKVGTHCEHVSEGCRNCYAETFNRRGLPGAGTGLDYKPGHRDRLEHFIDEKMLVAPLKRRKPTRYFLSSLTDVFGAWVTDDMLDRLFAVMALCPQHVFQVLTKRPSQARAYLADLTMRGRLLDQMDVIANRGSSYYSGWPLLNVWLGTSVEDQAAADARIPHLLATPAVVRFLSCEPLLGPVDLAHCWHDGMVMVDALVGRHGVLTPFQGINPKLDWVIVGGESGPGSRPMHPDWARSLRDQCAAAGVPFFFKQHGDWAHEGQVGWLSPMIPTDRAVQRGEFFRIGKKAAGRLLDGVEHNGVPE